MPNFELPESNEDITHADIVILPRQDRARVLRVFVRKALHFVRAKFWLALLCIVTAGAVAAAYNELAAPLYRAELSFRPILNESISPLADQHATFDADIHWQTVTKRLLSDPAIDSLIKDADIAAILRAELIPTPANELKNRFISAMNVTYEPELADFKISVKDRNPALTRAILKALPESYAAASPLTAKISPDTYLDLSATHSGWREQNGLFESAPKKSLEPKEVTRQNVFSWPKTVAAQAIAAIIRQKEKESVPTVDDTNTLQRIAILKTRIALLQNLVNNPYGALPAGLPGSVITARQAIGGAQAKLQKAINSYQIPSGEKAKMEAAITAAKGRYVQSIRNALATFRTELAGLESPPTPKLATTMTPSIPATIPLSPPVVAPAPKSMTVMAEPITMPVTPVDATNLSALLHSINEAAWSAVVGIAPLATPVTPDRPVSPNKPRNFAWALALGGLVGVIVAAIVGFQDDVITSAEDLLDEFSVPVLGMLSQGKS